MLPASWHSKEVSKARWAPFSGARFPAGSPVVGVSDALPPTPLSEQDSQSELLPMPIATAAPAAAAAGTKRFIQDGLHSSRIPDMLAAPREARALESAQSLIERQKARIEELTETVLLLQQGRGDKEQRLQADLENYVHENQRLRLQLDSLKGEVEALDQLRRRGDKEVQSLVETVAAAEKGIAERDALIRHLQSTDKTAENERLKEEQQRLLHRLNKLQKLAGTTGEGEADGRTPQDLAGDLVRVQRDIELHRGTTRQLGNTIEELRISKMCLVQSEANLLEGQKLIEEQRAEIQRLYKIVEALNREKALVPPVVLTLPKHLRGAGEAQLEALSNKMGLILQALDRERQLAADDDREDRTSLALVQQRMFEEQQVILKRLLEGFERLDERFWGRGESWRTDGSFFYSGTVLHAVIEAEEEEADYREKIMAVKEGMLLFFLDPKDEEPTTVLRPHKMQSLSIDPNLLQIRLGYEPCLGRMETHLIKLMTEDELNRWSHGLAYGGFLRTAAASAPPPLPSAPPSSRPPSVREEEILVNVSVPEGVAFDGVPTSRERHDGHIQYNEARNVLIITSPDDTSPLTIPCSLVTMSVDKDAHAITFKSAESPEISITVSTQEKFFLELAAVAGAGKYYQPPAKLTPPPSPKEPEESTEKPKPPEDDEVFVIRDGYLMLFEKAGDPQPILKLHNADCVTLADATNREFVITHKPGTPEEETYVFSFPTDEIYQGWYNKLEENGFLRRKGDQRGRTANQVGVVSKGCLELYKDYGAPQAKPVITLMANRCSATASRERREIRIIHTNPSGKRERITLDCASLAEFDRWNVALHFGNFLKGEDLQGTGSQAYANLSKYVFPINMFEDASGRKSALLIENRMIMLFPTPDATDPILCFPANECEVQPVIAQRKLRVYVNRNTRREQRIDFILPLAKDLDRYTAACQRDSFPEAVVGKPMEKLNIPFVLCRKGLMAVYKSKFHTHAELTLEVSRYSFSEEGSTYIFTNLEGKEPPRKATVTSPDSRERWEFALKLTGFKPFSTVQLPRFFLPQIIYGFVAEEASELRKEGLLGNARAALGLLNLQRENRGSTFQTDQQTHRSQPRSDSGSR